MRLQADTQQKSENGTVMFLFTILSHFFPILSSFYYFISDIAPKDVQFIVVVLNEGLCSLLV